MTLSKTNSRMPKVLDTFAGAGGFSLGFALAGFEVIGAIEKDKWACETFSLNHPHAITLHRKTGRFCMRVLQLSLAACLAWSLVVSAEETSGDVKLSRLFTPHMVLQRDMAAPIWGTAAPGVKVTVTFAGQTKTATADAKGAWRVTLDALKASAQPQTLTVGGKEIPDVLVGDVWLGAGQSNMDLSVGTAYMSDPVLSGAVKAGCPKIRFMRQTATSVWEEATPQSLPKLSALLLAFGLALQREVDVPIGFMIGAVGGSPSVCWLSEDMYKSDTECAEALKKFASAYNHDEALAQYKKDLAKYTEEYAAWKTQADAAKKEGKGFRPAPAAPKKVFKAGEVLYGVHPGGGRIAQNFEPFIRPYVGYGIKGVLWDQGESGTAVCGLQQCELMGALIRGWRTAWGQGDFPFLYVQKPSGGGGAWDYKNPVTRHAEPFKPQPDEIPAPPTQDDYSHFHYASIMRHPNTHMVTSTDLGSGMHPVNKRGYGERAAQVALAVAYGKKIEYLGPQYASHEIKNGRVIIRFTHIGQGLAFKNGDKLQGFIIAGADKKFVWADAVIDGETVVVSSKDVKEPVAARYAWSGVFPWANLFNKDGLPATQFRTDAW
jgi:sialate O-acetylesterase